MHQPWRNIASLLHKSAQRKPQTIKDSKFIRRFARAQLPILKLLSVPLVRAEAANEEEHNANSDVGKYNAHPDLIGQRVQEREDTRLGFLWLLDHNGYAQTHERFREVNHLLSNQSDGKRSYSYVCFLSTVKREGISQMAHIGL